MSGSERDRGKKFDDMLFSSFTNWETPVPETNWYEINESLDAEEAFRENKKAFDSWDAETPPPAIWESLNQSLDRETPSEFIRESYEKWEVEPEQSTWTKINESLEIERVWEQVEQTLYPKTRNKLFSKLAASVFLLLITGYTKDSLESELTSTKTTPSSVQVSEDKTNTEKGKNRNNLSTQHHPFHLTYQGVEKADNNLLIAISGLNSNPEPTQFEPDLSPETEKHHLAFYKPVLLASEKNPDPKKISFTNYKVKRKTGLKFGIYTANSANLIFHSSLHDLSSFRSSYGYELGALASHKLAFFEQEYLLGYVNVNQYENNFNNGTYNEDKLHLSSIKLNTFTKLRLGKIFSPGAGISLLFPLNSVVTRQQTVVQLPETNPVNLGFVLGFDIQNRLFHNSNRMVFGFKYEHIFSLNQKSSYFKTVQNLSFGMKFKF